MRVSTWLRPFVARLNPVRQRRARPRPAFRPRVEGLEDRLTPSGGLLDPTFGSGGVVTTSPINTGRISTSGGASVTQPDGKIVVVGSSIVETTYNAGYVDVIRYNTNGTLDVSFNKGGVVTTKFGTRVSVTGVALDPLTQKIVVSGGESGGVHLVRYNTNGTLDKTFNGGTGDALASFPAFGTFQSSGLAVAPVGGTWKLLVYGSDGGGDFALVRFNLDGTLDTSFGTGGHVATEVSPDAPGGGLDGERIRSAVVLPDGRVLASGVAGWWQTVTNSDGTTSTLKADELVVVRYDPAGHLDPTFGVDPNTGAVGGGVSAIRDGFWLDGRSIALAPDGKIVVGGSGAVLARFYADGTPDVTFAPGGHVNTGLGGDVNAVAVQADGGILAASRTSSGSFLFRYRGDGTPDATFGTGGTATLPFNTPWGQGAAVQADGRILLTGCVNNRLGAARYLASAPQVTSFTASPNPVTGGSGVALAAAVAPGNPGAAGAASQVAFYADSNGDGVLDPAVDTLLGYATYDAGSGQWRLTISTAGWAPGTYTLFARAKDGYGAWSDPFALVLTIQ
jgi:uncharacterized delta-60 repeat protein